MLCIAGVVGQSEARAEPCAPPSPACHLDNGKRLLNADPRRAAEELLASYQLDERTDTLVLYATALQLAGRYALALETWKRVIVFRDSEVETAKETLRTASGRRLEAARRTMERAQRQSEEAAAAIIKLWPEVGRVRIRFAPGQELAVSRDGVEVDATREVIVNAGSDELVFTRKDGSADRVVVEVAAGGVAKIDAPANRVARPAPPKPQQVEPTRPVAERPIKQPVKPDVPETPAAETTETEPEAAEDPEPESEAAPEPSLASTRFVDEPRSRTMSRVGLGLAAGSVAAGGIAIGLAVLGSSDRDRSRELGCTTNDQCPFGQAADLAERANDRTRLAQLSAIGAGALLATGATLWIVGRKTTRRAAPDVALHIGPSSAALAWRF